MGKRRKWRTGFVPFRVVGALRAHSADHGNDFEDSKSEMTLLSSVSASTTKTAQAKHLFLRDRGPHADWEWLFRGGRYQVITTTVPAKPKTTRCRATSGSGTCCAVRRRTRCAIHSPPSGWRKTFPCPCWGTIWVVPHPDGHHLRADRPRPQP